MKATKHVFEVFIHDTYSKSDDGFNLFQEIFAAPETLAVEDGVVFEISR